MSRSLLLAAVLVVWGTSSAWAQPTGSGGALPAQGITLDGKPLTPLARVGLERVWYTAVPLDGPEKVLLLSMAENMLFAQTSMSNFHAYDSETGRYLWSADLGTRTGEAYPVSVNSKAVFVSGSQLLYALDRRTGRTLWAKKLEALSSSATAANEERVSVGLSTGKLATYDLKTLAPAFFFQTNGELTARPILAGQVVAFASHDRRVYVAQLDPPKLVFRFLTGGPISASMGTHGTRTLLVPSHDHNLYAIDLFTGDSKWVYASGAPIQQEPLVARDDVYVLNVEGMLSSLNALTGEPHWSLSTGGGRLLAVSEDRVYLETQFRDLFVVDRKSGAIVADARSVRDRAGLDLRDFTITPTNPLNGRIYLGSHAGMIVCLREQGRIKPYLLRDPNAPPFGYIPRQGEVTTPGAAPAETPSTDAAAKPGETP
jgi:outer membrane protein assembly factor BamB